MMRSKIDCYDFDISFVLLTYNQEHLIVELLDSLLVQRSKFLQQYNIQLIVSDDGSHDNTINIIRKWLDKNGQVFDACSVLAEDINKGTCSSFVKAIRCARGRYIKPIAGDDVFLDNDLSKVFSALEVNDVIITPSKPFGTDASGFYDTKFNKRKFAINRYLSSSYKRLSAALIPAPETPGCFYRRSVFTERVLDFISGFDLIEDRSFWIKVFEENEELKISSLNEAFVGYRYHAASVSKGVNSSIKLRYINDQRKLTIYQAKNCSSFIYKLIYFYELLLMEWNLQGYKFLNFRALAFNFSFYKTLFINKIGSKADNENGA